MNTQHPPEQFQMDKWVELRVSIYGNNKYIDQKYVIAGCTPLLLDDPATYNSNYVDRAKDGTHMLKCIPDGACALFRSIHLVRCETDADIRFFGEWKPVSIDDDGKDAKRDQANAGMDGLPDKTVTRKHRKRTPAKHAPTGKPQGKKQ